MRGGEGSGRSVRGDYIFFSLYCFFSLWFSSVMVMTVCHIQQDECLLVITLGVAGNHPCSLDE